ncbi:hypothetical protein [Levilactobacillus senmaizukei]|uniref:hypothetical protein n=1 Tax=Levilactobacillus senmaizukei TaxID=431273 RepID=UPI00077C0625|nr:hypothetical protein [Levilactobacillus senmaizukei]
MGLYVQGGKKVGGMYMADGRGNATKVGGMYYADGRGNATKIYSSFYPSGYVFWQANNANGNGFGINATKAPTIIPDTSINQKINISGIKNGIRVYININQYYGYSDARKINMLFNWNDSIIPGGYTNLYWEPSVATIDIPANQMAGNSTLYMSAHRGNQCSVFINCDSSGFHFISKNQGTVFDLTDTNYNIFSILLVQKIVAI